MFLSCNCEHYDRRYSKGKSFNFSIWQPQVEYTNDLYKQDFVNYDGNIYVCLKTNNNEIPSESKNWLLVMSKLPGVTVVPVITEDGLLSWEVVKDEINLPDPINIKGPKGDPGFNGQDGENGQDGITPIFEQTVKTNSVSSFEEAAVKLLNITDNKYKFEFFIPKGKDGIDGKDGEKGDPFILKTSPEECKNLNEAYIDSENYIQVLIKLHPKTFVNCGKLPSGKDGHTPEIGINNNWYINGKDTGKPSRGNNGDTPKFNTNIDVITVDNSADASASLKEESINNYKFLLNIPRGATGIAGKDGTMFYVDNVYPENPKQDDLFLNTSESILYKYSDNNWNVIFKFDDASCVWEIF